MPAPIFVESSSSGGTEVGRGPLTEPGRLRVVEIIVPWQMSESAGDAPQTAPAAPLEPPCEMVVDWQMGGPVFARTGAARGA